MRGRTMRGRATPLGVALAFPFGLTTGEDPADATCAGLAPDGKAEADPWDAMMLARKAGNQSREAIR